MLTFLAAILFGVYHVYITNPESFNVVKTMAIFGVLHVQMFVEHAVNESKKLWYICEKYVKKNIVPREKIFSNKHILECRVISYDLEGSVSKKMPIAFTEQLITEEPVIESNTLSVTEIVFDNLEKVRLVSPSTYSVREQYNKIEQMFTDGCPTRLKCPFMCVEVLYDENRYDITSLLKEYLYTGNVILNLPFIRMFMIEHLGVYVKPGEAISLHMVDHDVNISDIHYHGRDKHMHYDYVL
jgi:hypothetical protein